MLEEFMPFVGLIIFGNIENLILASQGVVAGVNPKVLGLLSIFAVVVWLFIGFVATDVAMQYSQYITFLGGLAIVILGIISIRDAQFTGLLIFGNIENLILASQGAVAHVDPFILSILSLIAVVIWLLLGTYGTKLAIKYADYIEIFGGVAIIVLGIQSMLEAMGL